MSQTSRQSVVAPVVSSRTSRGVPVRLGRKGVEKIIELKLTDDEVKQLRASASHLQSRRRTC